MGRGPIAALWTSLRNIGLQIAPILAVAIGAIYTVSSLAPERTATRLAVYCFTPLVALAFIALVSVLLPRRTAILMVLVAMLMTPIASGCTPAMLMVLFGDPTKEFELGALASFPILLGLLPAWLAWSRIGRAPFGTLHRAAVRRLWLTAAITIACGASLSWNPPETSASAERSFAAILWNPPPQAWADDFRSTASVALIILCACGLTVLVVTMLDWNALKRIRAVRTGTRSPPATPYREALVVVAEPQDASERLRRSVRTDLVCSVLAGIATIYLLGRVQHLKANMETIDVVDGDGPRSLTFPSLRFECEQLQRDDPFRTVSMRLSLARATYEQGRAGEYQWRPNSPRQGRAASSCDVTFDESGSLRYSPQVLTVNYREATP